MRLEPIDHTTEDVELQDIYVDDVKEFELTEDGFRAVFTVTRHGKAVPTISIVLPARKVPGIIARAITAIQNSVFRWLN